MELKAELLERVIKATKVNFKVNEPVMVENGDDSRIQYIRLEHNVYLDKGDALAADITQEEEDLVEDEFLTLLQALVQDNAGMSQISGNLEAQVITMVGKDGYEILTIQRTDIGFTIMLLDKA